MDSFEDKVAVVTGAASGIGRGLAEAFAAAGMRVVISDVEEPALTATASELRSGGAEVHAVVTDVSDPDAVAALAEATIEKFGAVHVVCNNAGVYTGSKPCWKSTLDDWAWILGVNLMGVVHGIRTFLPIMIEQKEEGYIVNTASLAGVMTGGSLYGATKSAVVALSETVYLELVAGGYKPRISVLCPGVVAANIYISERNRPAKFADAGPRPTGWSTQEARKAFGAGLDPRAVGEQVLRGIREERFYIFTEPAYPPHEPHIRHRMIQLLNAENPTLLPFGG